MMNNSYLMVCLTFQISMLILCGLFASWKLYHDFNIWCL